MNADLKQRIAARIEEFIETPSHGETLRESVSKLNVLPLFLDMGGCYAITLDGDIVSFAWDNEMDIRIEREERIRNLALYQGSEKYPELRSLIPPRPVDAITCRYCKGTGQVLLPE